MTLRQIKFTLLLIVKLTYALMHIIVMLPFVAVKLLFKLLWVSDEELDSRDKKGK